MTDIDLHEECFYGNKHRSIGGVLSRDFTNGCGPEEYNLMNGVIGNYKIKVKYFANHQQSLTGGTTILCKIFTNYMKKNEESKLITIRLNKNQTDLQIGEIFLK